MEKDIKNNISNKVKMSLLCQTYGKLLTEKQYAFLEDYYNNDLSLSEIAENYNITRQAARDNIKKGENKLLELEAKLGIMEKTLVQEEVIADILSKITKIKAKSSDKQVANILEEIKCELNYLV